MYKRIFKESLTNKQLIQILKKNGISAVATKTTPGKFKIAATIGFKFNTNYNKMFKDELAFSIQYPPTTSSGKRDEINDKVEKILKDNDLKIKRREGSDFYLWR